MTKCKFALRLIPLSATSNLFSLEVVQKCLHCQLYALWENSIVRVSGFKVDELRSL